MLGYFGSAAVRTTAQSPSPVRIVIWSQCWWTFQSFGSGRPVSRSPGAAGARAALFIGRNT
eukprot:556109-Alexandrium_andersonii.AAC.1